MFDVDTDGSGGGGGGGNLANRRNFFRLNTGGDGGGGGGNGNLANRTKSSEPSSGGICSEDELSRPGPDSMTAAKSPSKIAFSKKTLRWLKR